MKLTAARLADGPAQGKAIAALEDQDRGTALAAEARIVAPAARGSMFVVLFPGAAVGLVGRLVEQNGRRNDGHVAWVAVAHDLGVKRRIAVGRKEPLNTPPHAGDLPGEELTARARLIYSIVEQLFKYEIEESGGVFSVPARGWPAVPRPA